VFQLCHDLGDETGGRGESREKRARGREGGEERGRGRRGGTRWG